MNNWLFVPVKKILNTATLHKRLIYKRHEETTLDNIEAFETTLKLVSLISNGIYANSKIKLLEHGPFGLVSPLAPDKLWGQLIPYIYELSLTYQDLEAIWPLSISVMFKNPLFTMALIQHGADVNIITFNRFTPLYSAVATQNLKLVRILIAAGANVNARGAFNETPLIIAADDEHEETYEICVALIEANADVNAKDFKNEQTALHKAYQRGNGAVINLLISNGANQTSRDARERIPLDMLFDEE